MTSAAQRALQQLIDLGHLVELLTSTNWVTKVEGSMGERGSWFCNWVISNCINMLSVLSPKELLLDVLLEDVLLVDVGVLAGCTGVVAC